MTLGDRSLWAALVVVLLGCNLFSESESETDADDDDESTGRATTTASAGGPDRPAQSTGIPECDQYLAEAARCNPSWGPQLDQLRAGYEAAAKNPQMKEMVAKTCSQQLATTRQNCSGATEDGPPKPTAEATPTPPPAPPPPSDGASQPPTVEEWNAVTKEVTVWGSSYLGCETKMLREWLRVSCRGTNKSGGTPTGVDVVVKQGQANALTYTGAGVTSLLLRFVSGVHVEADFHWTDMSRRLVVDWPQGAPEPEAKGKFNDTPTHGGYTDPCQTSSEELPCRLRDGRVGWCKSGRCKDICPAGQSYSHLDAGCHYPCSRGCSGSCMEGLCFP